MRQKDHKGEQVSSQNIKTLSKLVDAVDHGDCVALFPEGVSRYASQLAPLKTGIARVAAQVLQRHAHEPDFRLCVTTTSLTYLHRANFRSNVLLVVNPPIVLTPGTHPDLARPLAEHAEKDDPALIAVRALTSQIDAALRSGTLDSPSWRILRVAHTARRIHEPIESIHQSLGDYVRSTQRWIELFVSANAPTEDAARMVENERIIALGQRLHAYQDRLGRVGVKDARIAEDSDAWLIELSGRLLGRVIWCCILGLIALPGLVLWLPILVFAKRKEVAWRKRGPTWDVIDEVAQTKVMNGLLAFVCVWFGAMLLTLPVAAITFFAVPIAMWLSLRWLEDLAAALRGGRSLARLIVLHTTSSDLLMAARAERESLKAELEHIAEIRGLTRATKATKPLQRRRAYFSIRRRRGRDWAETLRLLDWDADASDAEALDADASY